MWAYSLVANRSLNKHHHEVWYECLEFEKPAPDNEQKSCNSPASRTSLSSRSADKHRSSPWFFWMKALDSTDLSLTKANLKLYNEGVCKYKQKTCEATKGHRLIKSHQRNTRTDQHCFQIQSLLRRTPQRMEHLPQNKKTRKLYALRNSKCEATWATFSDKWY